MHDTIKPEDISRTLPLYQLANLRDELDVMLAETDGEVTPEIDALLDQLQGATNDKVERVALYILELQRHADAIRAEESRLDAMATAKEKTAEGLKKYLLANLQRLDIKKVAGQLATVSVVANTQPAVTTPLEAVALWAVDDARPFVKREEKVVYSLDREKILAAWKDGTPLPLAIKVERGSHLRVR